MFVEVTDAEEVFMRRWMVNVFAFGAMFFPNVGTAQVTSRPAPSPVVTAAGAEWQMAGGPIFYAGNFYYPAGPSIFFDGNVMARMGSYQSVPIYANTTLEPWSIIYVPVGGNVMRPYERLRAGELAGTTGSRTPSFPVQGPNDPAVLSGTPLGEGTAAPELSQSDAGAQPIVNSPPPANPAPPSARRTLEMISGKTGNEGAWITYEGDRWYYTGKPIKYNPDRFVPFGSYHGFMVYKEKSGPANMIYVTNKEDGPLVPYLKR